MLKCVRWPGQSGLSCPFWQILGNISIHLSRVDQLLRYHQEAALELQMEQLTGVNAQKKKVRSNCC